MNCRRVEELIPLYVEDDLKVGESRQIAAHLDACAECRASLEEMSDSQKWIRSFSEPDFDEAFFDHLRSGVLRGIEMKERRPSFFSLLTERLLQRPALAATVALLIIVAAATLYVYSGKTKNEKDERVVATQQKKEDQQEEKKPAPDQKEEKKPRPRQNRRPRLSGVMLAQSEVAIGPEKEIAIEPDHVPENVDESFPTLGTGSEERALTPENVMRIEFRTADPNIRIIWFAPKENESKKTKPVTDQSLVLCHWSFAAFD